jgi:Na+/melibiose symporter-like transporter
MKKLARNSEARWLVTLGAVLSTATYMSAWLAALYYASMGVSPIWFGAILAVRSLWKAWLSHHFTQERHIARNMATYALLAAAVYAAMASRQLWLLWVVLGHDAVQSLQSQPITAKLNQHIAHEYRATMNSLVNLVQRLLYTVAGPLIGLLIDKTSLGVGFVATGATCGLLAFTAIAQLHKRNTFREEE